MRHWVRFAEGQEDRRLDGSHCGFGRKCHQRQGAAALGALRSDFAMPFYLSGGLLAVLAVLCASVFAMPPHKRRKRMVEGMASAVIEEEAPASIAVSGKPDGASRRNRRRHATHRRSGRASSQSSQSEATETPVIIDPSSRNLVADQQTGAESGAEPGLSAGDNESTSVITPDELQAYFSRLAQEVNTGDDSADDGQEES